MDGKEPVVFSLFACLRMDRFSGVQTWSQRKPTAEFCRWGSRDLPAYCLLLLEQNCSQIATYETHESASTLCQPSHIGFPELIKKGYLYSAVMSWALQPFTQRTRPGRSLPPPARFAFTGPEQLIVGVPPTTSGGRGNLAEACLKKSSPGLFSDAA